MGSPLKSEAQRNKIARRAHLQAVREQRYFDSLVQAIGKGDGAKGGGAKSGGGAASASSPTKLAVPAAVKLVTEAAQKRREVDNKLVSALSTLREKAGRLQQALNMESIAEQPESTPVE